MVIGLNEGASNIHAIQMVIQNIHHCITLAEWYKITSYNKGANNIHAIQMVIQTTNIHILQHCLRLTPFLAKLNKSVSPSSIHANYITLT